MLIGRTVNFKELWYCGVLMPVTLDVKKKPGSIRSPRGLDEASYQSSRPSKGLLALRNLMAGKTEDRTTSQLYIAAVYLQRNQPFCFIVHRGSFPLMS